LFGDTSLNDCQVTFALRAHKVSDFYLKKKPEMTLRVIEESLNFYRPIGTQFY